MSLAPQVQEEMYNQVKGLRRYGILDDLVWFGFGVKQTISELAGSEEGLSFVTLCATLVTYWDATFSANILLTLCKRLNVP